TLTLCALNLLVAVVFVVLLVLDYGQRNAWSHAAFMHVLAAEGLPLKMEDSLTTGWQVSQNRKLEAEQVKAALTQRGGKPGDAKGWVEPVDVPGGRIQPGHLTTEILKEHFSGVGEPVDTLDAEIERLNNKVPADIEAYAKEFAAAVKDDQKAVWLYNTLLPLAYDVHQVQMLAAKIQATKGAGITALLEEAIERRLLLEILGPCEAFRPGDVKSFVVEKGGDLEYLKLDQLKDLLRRRFEGAIANTFDPVIHQGKEWEGQGRTSWERRQAIAFLLFAIGNMKKLDATPFYDGGLERCNAVVGHYEFNRAAQNLVVAYQKLEEKVLESIAIDRQGYEILLKDKAMRSQSFIDQHHAEIKRIKDLVADLRKAEARLEDLKEQKARADKLFEERKTHEDQVVKRLIAQRAETKKLAMEVKQLQIELFEAQVILSEAFERNNRLEQRIREASAPKGGSTP
ncbi:MAG: hypothetical protein L0Y70_25400, partial [Gemmataceae bacterium]|nr:hypothetical protein [Gemmataceae bacterium]